MTLIECYKILQVTSDADLETIKKAYRKRAFELHPDLHPTDADASRRFQELNEAYVVLSQHVERVQGSDEVYSEAKRKFDEQQRTSWKKSSWKPSWGSSSGNSSGNSAGNSSDSSSGNSAGSGSGKGSANNAGSQSKEQKQYSSYNASQKEVLQDILKDPFARRVFEDIYSEIRKGQSGAGASASAGKAAASSTTTTTTSKKVSLGWDKKNDTQPAKQNGGVSGWLKRQLDDEKIIYLPPQNLIPGTRLRLQIQIGLNKTPKVVELTIPRDYIVGKSIRLKELGRSIGSWKGDLYLKLFAKV